jgi:hypothetical protein
MASVLWDAEGILFIDYLEKGKTIIGEYYCSLLTRLDEKIRGEKTRFAKEKNHLSSGQCTLPQKCFGNGKGKLRDLHYELLEHPTYSPDLAPSDLCLIKTETLPRWSPFFFE